MAYRKKHCGSYRLLFTFVGVLFFGWSFCVSALMEQNKRQNEHQISFSLPLQTMVNGNDQASYLRLLLPVPKNKIVVDSQLTLVVKQRAVPAIFTMITAWPSNNAKQVRLLAIDIPSVYGFSESFTLTWQGVEPQQTNIATNALTLSSSALIAPSLTPSLIHSILVYPDISWLLASVLLQPMVSPTTQEWYIGPQKKFANYVSNTELLRSKKYPPEQSSQWLYDRPQALYQLFMMSGDKSWFNHANRLSTFYIDHLGENGFFTLRKGNDTKYLMPRGVLYRYLLTADPRAKNAIAALFEASLDWDPVYDIGRGFWTERNQAAALNVAISQWELTNSTEALERINDIIDATVDMTFKPGNNWKLVGCPQHSFKAHEGWGDKSPACSPWMMALLGDALWRYYRLTEDKRAAALIDAFGDFILNHSLFYGDKRVKNIPIAKYLVSLNNPKQEEPNQWTDPQHACDIAGLLGKSVYIKEKALQDSFMGQTIFSAFAKQCYGMYHTLQGKKKAEPYWTLKPPRRFGWMYSSTSDLPWLVEKHIPELLLGY